MSIPEALGAEIRAEAAALEITLVKLAARAGIDRTSLYKYLNASRAMPFTTLINIARELRLAPHELVRRAEERARFTRQ